MCLFAHPALAQSVLTIPGQDSVGFIQAIDQWLEGDDAEALPALAELAQGGNRAAQVFLGQIEQETYLHAHVTSDLPRRERIDLLRSPGGLSGRSWLTVAAEDVAFAQTLLDPRGSGLRLESTAVFLELEQPREALWGLLRLRSGDGPDFHEIYPDVAQLALHSSAPDEARWISLRILREMANLTQMAGTVPWTTERFQEVVDAFNQSVSVPSGQESHWRFLEFGLPGWDERDDDRPARHGAFLLQVPSLAPFAQVCSEQCPGQEDICMMVASFVTPEPLYLYAYSPAEWVVSTEDYRAANRFEADMLDLVELSPFVAQRRSYREEFDLCELPF